MQHRYPYNHLANFCVSSTILHLLLLLSLVLRLDLQHAVAQDAAPVAVSELDEQSATLPAGFKDERIAAFASPTALAMTPDGRLLLTSKSGKLRIYQNGVLLATPALDLSQVVCSDFERGLLSIAVDPDFADNHYIYLYYTFKKFDNCTAGPPSPTNPVNRVSRFRLPDSNLINPSSEFVLVDNIMSNFGNHNAGDLHFGANRLLYISTGDGGKEATDTRSVAHLSGKILRVTSEGEIPSVNPWADAAGVRRCGDPAGLPAGKGPCGEVYAYGLRNPFRFAFRPESNQFFINDVGQNDWEEINEGKAGADYGWNQREGACAYPAQTPCDNGESLGFREPIHSYNHDTGCLSITGGVFIPDRAWPAPYAGSYLFGDFGCGNIFRLERDPPYRRSTFISGLDDGTVISMAFGKVDSLEGLYYTTFRNGGEIRRIVYTGCFTYRSADGVVALPNGQRSLSSTIQVPEAVEIGDLNVSLTISHTYVGDLSVTLTHAETNDQVAVIERPKHPERGGGCKYNNIVADLSDEATIPVEDTCEPRNPTINGRFKPNHPLSLFDHQSSQGTWVLRVIDADTNEDAGSLRSWRIRICSATLRAADLDDTTLDDLPIPDQPADESDKGEKDGLSPQQYLPMIRGE